MQAVIILGDTRHRLDLEPGTTLEAAFRTLGGLPDTHLFLRGKTPVPMTAPMQEGDEIVALRIASGG